MKKKQDLVKIINKQNKLKDIFQILKIYYYICPFCLSDEKFSNYNHIKSKNCKKNIELFINNNNVYIFNEKINLIKKHRKYIVQNYNNIKLLNEYFDELLKVNI
jgi:hypothetical protein